MLDDGVFPPITGESFAGFDSPSDAFSSDGSRFPVEVDGLFFGNLDGQQQVSVRCFSHAIEFVPEFIPRAALSDHPLFARSLNRLQAVRLEGGNNS
jgi:hypothetical protein